MAARLAKLSYYGANPEAILNAPVDIVMGLVRFENVELEYTNCFRSLNDNE